MHVQENLKKIVYVCVCAVNIHHYHIRADSLHNAVYDTLNIDKLSHS
jgi:hypothetical protein